MVTREDENDILYLVTLCKQRSTEGNVFVDGTGKKKFRQKQL